MKNRTFVIVSAVSACAIAGVLTIMHSNTPLAQTDAELGIRWCNSYVPHDNRTNDFFPISSVNAGQIKVSGMNTIEWMDGAISLHKIKYGNAQPLKKLGTIQAALYLLDAATIKRYSPDARVMYLHPISSVGPNEFEEIIHSIQQTPGNTKPFFAIAMGPRAIKSAGLQVQVSGSIDFVITPVWWNRNTSTVLSVMAKKSKVSRVQGMKDLSKFVSYTTRFGVAYDPDSTNCDPDMISKDIWITVHPLPADVLSDMYIATSIPPKEGKATVILKALFDTQGWPTTD